MFNFYLFYNDQNTGYKNLSKIPLVGIDWDVSVVLVWGETRVPKEKTMGHLSDQLTIYPLTCRHQELNPGHIGEWSEL